MCVVLAHFYCRKPNWSARVSARPPSSRSPSNPLPSFPPARRVYFANPPTAPLARLEPLFQGYVPAAHRVLNTNRECFLSRVPQDFSDAIITINEENSTLRRPTRPISFDLSTSADHPLPLRASSPSPSIPWPSPATTENLFCPRNSRLEVSRPIVMHDYSLRYRATGHRYIRDLQFLCRIPSRALQVAAQSRRVVELWKRSRAVAAPCHCLKFSYPLDLADVLFSYAQASRPSADRDIN